MKCRPMLQHCKAGHRVQCVCFISCNIGRLQHIGLWCLQVPNQELVLCMHSSSGSNWKHIGCLHSCMLMLDLRLQTLPCAADASADVLILLTEQALRPPVFDGCFKTPTDLACILSAPWVDIALKMHMQHQIHHADAVQTYFWDLPLGCDEEHAQCLCSLLMHTVDYDCAGRLHFVVYTAQQAQTT